MSQDRHMPVSSRLDTARDYLWLAFLVTLLMSFPFFTLFVWLNLGLSVTFGRILGYAWCALVGVEVSLYALLPYLRRRA